MEKSHWDGEDLKKSNFILLNSVFGPIKRILCAVANIYSYLKSKSIVYALR